MNLTVIKSNCFIFSLLIALSDIFAQSAIKFERFSVDQGLSQSSGAAILQDRDGFMWFGTQDGLNKFDGVNFKIYRHDPEDSASISSNSILAMHQDTDGFIWIGSEGALDKFDASREVFYSCTNKLNAGLNGRNNQVLDITSDHNGNVWLATYSGLVRYDKNTNDFTCFLIDSLADQEIDTIKKILIDKSQVFWLVTGAGKLYHFNPAANKFSEQKVEIRNNRAKAGAVANVFEDNRGDIWLITSRPGLIKFNRETRAFDLIKKIENDWEKSLCCIAEDQNRNLWLGTSNNGLYRLDRGTGLFQHFVNDAYNQWSLNNNNIQSLLVDKAGTLWIGTSGGGINKYNPEKQRFAHIKSNLRNPVAMQGDFVWAIFEDARGLLWIGLQNGGLNVFDRQTGAIKVYKHDYHDVSSISSNTVFSICEDKNENVWIGTYGGGLNKFDRKSGKFKCFAVNLRNPEGLMSKTIRSLFVDENGFVWLATMGDGLNRLNPVTEEFYSYLHQPENLSSLSSNMVSALFQDKDNNLWVGTINGGLNKLDKKNEKFTRFYHDPGNKNSLSSNYIMSICQDLNGDIWVGTYYGLDRLNGATNEFTHYTTKDGLPNNVIYGVLADDNGCIWVSTNNGIAKLNPQSGKIKNFDADDGLQSKEFNSGAFFKNNKGEMFFGGVNGLNIFHPDSVRDNPYIPPTVITGVKIFDKYINNGTQLVSPLELSYKDNFTTFEFVALNYTNTHKNQYAYKMDGLHQDWIHCANRRYATFTNLAPGKYVFRVKGANNDGVWNETGAALSIIVTPPFWKTWWFLWMAVVASLTGLILVVKDLQQRQKRKAELDKKFSELKLQALRAQMNPHFIFNTLNSIQYFISSNDPKSAYLYLSKFSKLMRLVLDNSELSKTALAEELDALKLYLELESLRFEGKFNYRLKVSPDIDVHNTEIPTMLIQPFVENAIQHGLRFKRTKGNLEIRLEKDNGSVVCFIEDNGVGITRAKAMAMKSKQNGKHKPTGIKLTKERLETLNALRKNDRAIEVVDLCKENGKIQGTRVKIVIPIESHNA